MAAEPCDELVERPGMLAAEPASAPPIGPCLLDRNRAPPPDLIRSTRTVEKGHGRIETRQISVMRPGTSPRAAAALWNTMLAIVHDVAEPLAEIRELFAENRLEAIAAAR